MYTNLIKKIGLTFAILNIFMIQTVMADTLFYYSAAVLPSIIANKPVDNPSITIPSMDIPKYIPDAAPDWSTLGEVNSTIDVNGLNDVQIKKITVTLDINHTAVSDLTIYLYSPTESIVLSDMNSEGRKADYNNTIFDDAADKSITDTDYSPPYNGSYRPEEPLSTFNGEVPDGIWTLRIVDNISKDTGTLNSWSITIE